MTIFIFFHICHQLQNIQIKIFTYGTKIAPNIRQGVSPQYQSGYLWKRRQQGFLTNDSMWPLLTTTHKFGMNFGNFVSNVRWARPFSPTKSHWSRGGNRSREIQFTNTEKYSLKLIEIKKCGRNWTCVERFCLLNLTFVKDSVIKLYMEATACG